jgi:hypothetical protein
MMLESTEKYQARDSSSLDVYRMESSSKNLFSILGLGVGQHVSKALDPNPPSKKNIVLQF